MANEELIYRITRAIYDRLGSSADESAVEQLVTDIYQTVEPALSKNGAGSIMTPSPGVIQPEDRDDQSFGRASAGFGSGFGKRRRPPRTRRHD